MAGGRSSGGCGRFLSGRVSHSVGVWFLDVRSRSITGRTRISARTRFESLLRTSSRLVCLLLPASGDGSNGGGHYTRDLSRGGGPSLSLCQRHSWFALW